MCEEKGQPIVCMTFAFHVHVTNTIVTLGPCPLVRGGGVNFPNVVVFAA